MAEQLSTLSSLLLVSRDRGKIQTIKKAKAASGAVYNIVNGLTPTPLKPEVRKTVKDGKVSFRVMARSKDEMKRIIKSLQKKHPELKADLSQMEGTDPKYVQEPLTLSFKVGGAIAGQSIAKTAIDFYVHKRGYKAGVTDLIQHLRSGTANQAVSPFYPNKVVCALKNTEVLHILRLRGDSMQGFLYCYVEFFSTYSWVVIMSENYLGSDFTEQYCYDVMGRKEVQKDIQFDLTRHDLLNWKPFVAKDTEHVKFRLTRIHRIVQQLHAEKRIHDITEDAFEKVARKYNRTDFTREMYEEVFQIVAEEFVEAFWSGKQLVSG